MILIVDNYDSFTYNLYQYVRALGRDAVIFRNDEIDCESIEKLDISHIIISPGPKSPDEAGNCMEIIERFHETLPILGICLGHQCIGRVFGHGIRRLSVPVHGKSAVISHDGRGVFKSVADGFHAIRYHSLEVIDKEDSKLELSARSGDGCIMAFSHQIYNTYGLQFHPESIGSQYGKELIGNFLNMKGGKR